MAASTAAILASENAGKRLATRPDEIARATACSCFMAKLRLPAQPLRDCSLYASARQPDDGNEHKRMKFA